MDSLSKVDKLLTELLGNRLDAGERAAPACREFCLLPPERSDRLNRGSVLSRIIRQLDVRKARKLLLHGAGNILHGFFQILHASPDNPQESLALAFARQSICCSIAVPGFH